MRLGKDKQAIILAVSLLFSASASGQAGKSYKYQLDGNLLKNDVLSGNQSVIVNYSISELSIENIINDAGIFYRITIPDHTPTSTPGKPELPVFSQLIALPEGTSFKVRISEVKSSRINPSVKKIDGILIPVQEGETKDLLQKKPEFLIDKAAYSSHGLISSDTVIIESLGTVRSKKLYNLYIFPVRYNPHSNILEVITSMKIEILFNSKDNFESKSHFTESPLFNQSLDQVVLNYNPDDVVPDYSDHPLSMVIITDSAFRKQLEPFFKWKTQKGFKLKVLYKGAGLAGNTFTQLKDTLTKIYNTSAVKNAPPEYLLIIGDVNRVPYYGTGNVTDMYYGEFDGNGDYIPDMYIGRLPVADTAELKSVITKIIKYEKFQFADSNKFYSRALVTAGNDAGYATMMNGQVKYAISNYFTNANKTNEYHFYYPQSTTTNAIDSIKKIINNGVGFINYTGHGSTDGWLYTPAGSAYYLKSSDIAQLTNKNMYPFVVTNACRTSQFNMAAAFGNKMVVADEKGAIGFIGCSNDSYWDDDFYWAVGPGPVSDDPTYQGKGLGAFDRLFHSHGEAPGNWYYTMGQINYAGNLGVSASTSTRKKYYWETYNLVGDPTVIPIIGRPESFRISLPDTLPNGIKSLSLNIDPFAYLAVSHFDTLWDASFASPSGSVELEMPGLSNDSCLIVITGQNKLPLIKTIYFKDINNEFINLKASAINDSIGNNNSRADFGESLFLKLTVSNLGLKDAHNLYAKISTISDLVTLNSDSVWIGNLPAKSEIVLRDDLRMTISENVPDMATAAIELVLKDQKTEKHNTIDISVHAPRLQIISCAMDDSIVGDGDHIADPGETFKLIFRVRNQGTSNTSGQFNIVSPDNNITILDPSVKSGLLKLGEITDIPIMLKLSESISTGSYFSVSSTLECGQYQVNKDYVFRVGRIRESFEASSFSIFPWINLSPIPWIITPASSYDGINSARSGVIPHNGTTSLIIRTIFSSTDSIKFFYKVSSEPNYDNFSFRLNDVEIFRKSGETSWIRKAVAVTAGLNKMEWIYKKDNSVSNGSDCVWIDMIDFAGSALINYVQRDLQVTGIEAPVQTTDQYGKETVTAKVVNIGKDIINGFNLAYELNNHSPVQQYFENKMIPYGDTVTVSFKTKADLSKYGIYKFIVYGYDNSDDYILNDTMKVTIENIEIIESLSIFPNPVTDHFTIFINSRVSDKLKISVFNLSGVKFYDFEKVINAGKNEINISDMSIPPGIYYLNIRGSAVNKTIPVMKINK